MAVIVSDTTPLKLPRSDRSDRHAAPMYGRILFPSAVWGELAHPRTPEPGLKWWAQAPSRLQLTHLTPGPVPRRPHLHDGCTPPTPLPHQHPTHLLLSS